MKPRTYRRKLQKKKKHYPCWGKCPACGQFSVASEVVASSDGQIDQWKKGSKVFFVDRPVIQRECWDCKHTRLVGWWNGRHIPL